MANINSGIQFGQHIDNLTQSLNLTKQRSNKIIKNIAHANVVGYQREDSDFLLHIDKANNQSPPKFASHKNEIMNLTGSGDGSIRLDGSTVDLEKEIVIANQTEVRYTTLTELMKRKLHFIRSSIREGK